MMLIQQDDEIVEKMQNINKTLYNMDFLYLDALSNGTFGMKNIKKNNLKYNNLEGGNEKNIQSSTTNNNDDVDDDENKDKTITLTAEKYDRIKKFVKSAKNAIVWYRDIAQNYYNSYNIVMLNYLYVLQLLKNQRDFLINKQQAFEKLSKDFSNGVEKISMLETMINNVEKIIKKTTNLDLEIKNKINGNQQNINAKATFGDEDPINLVDTNILIGGMNYDDFKRKIQNELFVDLNLMAEAMTNDNEFIEKKITSLHSKVKNIMIETQDLFNIRLSIEWLVNQLEKKQEEPEQKEGEEKIIEKIEEKDYTQIYEKLQQMVENVKKQQQSPKIAEYVRELEGMAKYLENFIESSKDTLKGLPDEKREEMLNTLKNLHGVTDIYLNEEEVGQTGGGFRNDYICKTKLVSKNI